MGTVLSLWTSSDTVTNRQKSVNPLVFTNFQLGVQNRLVKYPFGYTF